MSDALRELRRIAEKGFLDIAQAGQMYDVLWTANEDKALIAELNSSDADLAYNQIFRSLWESASMAILRFVDTQTNAATVSSFLQQARKEEVHQALIASVLKWPMIESHEEAEREVDDTIDLIQTGAKGVEKTYRAPFNRLRNGVLAHAQLIGGKKPTFDQLRDKIAACEPLAEDMLRLSTGSVASISDRRSIIEKSSNAFWSALHTGLIVPNDANDRSAQRN